jgi:hypothetical protein
LRCARFSFEVSEVPGFGKFCKHVLQSGRVSGEVIVTASNKALGYRTLLVFFALFTAGCAMDSAAPKLVEIRSPNGLETVGGDQFFWLGREPVTMVIDAGRAGRTLLRAKEFWFGPSAPELPFRSLVTECGKHRIEYKFTAGASGIPMQLDAGTQECRIWCTNSVTVTKQPNGDTRVLLLGLKGYYMAEGPDGGHK